MAALVAARRWRYILNNIKHLPAHSHYIAALADDEEAAEHADPDAKPQPPSLTDFDPVVRAVARLHDRVGELIRATVAASGGKPPDMATYPRPVLAADRLRKRQRRIKHESLVARVLPR